MYITVVGTGYVGLVAGACFADKGFDVRCIDIDTKKIDSLNNGKIPIYEPGLKEVVDRAVKREHLIFSTDLKAAVLASQAIFVCVGTPEGQDGRPNMNAVWAVVRSVAQTLKENPGHEFKVIVTKSTVPVGTGDKIEEILNEMGVTNVEAASNPEFLKEGCAINDFVKPDRVIIGAESQKAADVLVSIYEPFTRKSERIMIMDRKSAEMAKYAANSMLALRITFMNQLAVLCERVGADVSSVRKGLGTDTRIGSSFLFPGPGYGGSCFPKDVKALIDLGKINDIDMTIMNAVDVFNQKQKHYLADKVKNTFGEDMTGKTVGIWGLSFKPATDDVREAPALFIIQDLLDAGANIKAYDPEAMDTFVKELDHNNLTFCSTMYDAVKGCDCLVIVTDWDEFKSPNFERLAAALKSPIVFDGRNLYKPRTMKDLGFEYYGLGRKKL